MKKQETKRRGIAVISMDTNEEVEFVSVKPGRDMAQVERGMLINMNREQYMTRLVGE